MGANTSQAFPYRLGAEIEHGANKYLFRLYNGQAENGSEVTIFSFDKTQHSDDRLQAARNAMKRLKSFLYPHIVRYLDGVETETTVYIVTEPVVPLKLRLREKPLSNAEIALGLYQLSSAVSFINNDCKTSHCSINPLTVLVDRAGDWKLGGFELLYECGNGESAPALTRRNIDMAMDAYLCPLLAKADWQGLASGPHYATDSWSLGCVLHEVFNGGSLKRDQMGNIPKELVNEYRKLGKLGKKK
eukprot:TRINITY_DN11366_c0_g1_i1.p1 TRINITY_DN11366_c0_g1~~TRINITY_DN11366_c0_g1_i1.p1  ORF type:complete len:245 (+),score=35.79 TRINITY_DN11366_c0_g1_i1:85-819(+)